MTNFKVSISPELQLLADAQGWDMPDVRNLIYRGMLEKLTEQFRCGEEVTEYDIERWVKMEEIKS